MKDYSNEFILKGEYKATKISWILLCVIIACALLAFSILIFGKKVDLFALIFFIVLCIVIGFCAYIFNKGLKEYVIVNNDHIKMNAKDDKLWKTNTTGWNHISEKSFDIVEPLAECNTLLKYLTFGFLKDKNDPVAPIINFFNTVEISKDSVIYDKLYFLPECAAWDKNGKLVWKNEGTQYTDGIFYKTATIDYKSKDMEIKDAPGFYYKDGCSYDADGKPLPDHIGVTDNIVVYGEGDDQDFEEDLIETESTYYDPTRDALFLKKDVENIDGVLYGHETAFNISSIVGNPAKFAAAVNHFSGKNLFDIENINRMYKKVIIFYVINIASFILGVIILFTVLNMLKI